MKRVDTCIIGLGYIGLPTAAIITERGYHVHGVDIDETIVTDILNRATSLEEPQLKEAIQVALDENRLSTSTQPVEAHNYVIAVPTPLKKGFKPELKYVFQAVQAITPFLDAGNLIVLESTVPVGTTQQIFEIIKEKRSDLFEENKPGVYLAHCPERVLPGQIIKELKENDRIVGGINDISSQKAMEFYRRIVRGEILQTTAATAELCKLAENAYRDVNIAFANEISMVCESIDINPWELIALTNRHPRVNILNPGPGVGGHCIAVDPYFIADSAPNLTPLIQAARGVNRAKTRFVIRSITDKISEKGVKRLSLFGLSYKANVGDLRESPAVEIALALAQNPELDIVICEPYIQKLPKVLGQFANTRLQSLDVAKSHGQLLVILTDHRDFDILAKDQYVTPNLLNTRGPQI